MNFAIDGNKEGHLFTFEDEDFDEGLSPNQLYSRIEPFNYV